MPAMIDRNMLRRLSTSPLTILLCVFFGGLFGFRLPEFSLRLEVVGAIYVNLLHMVVVPLMVSAVIFSMQKLLSDGGTAVMLRRVLFVFLGISFSVAVIGILGINLLAPLTDLSAEARSALGQIVERNVDSGNTEMALFGDDPPVREVSVEDVVLLVIPSNIFSSLVNGETLKILVFSLMFGFALGYLPGKLSDSFNHSVEAVYRASQSLTQWINLPIPLFLFCMTASQIASTGFGPLAAMVGFVMTFAIICSLVMALSIVVIAVRSGCGYAVVSGAMRDPFSLGIATNNSVACIPVLIEAMSDKLNFLRAKVELMVPLSVSLLRSGATVYFVCGTLFIASLYGHQLSIAELAMVVFISVLSGFASSGMSGLTSITLMSSGCAYLGLPFEAAFILFVAVDPICAMARTAVTVIGSCAAVALICPKPEFKGA